MLPPPRSSMSSTRIRLARRAFKGFRLPLTCFLFPLGARLEDVPLACFEDNPDKPTTRASSHVGTHAACVGGRVRATKKTRDPVRVCHSHWPPPLGPRGKRKPFRKNCSTCGSAMATSADRRRRQTPARNMTRRHVTSGAPKSVKCWAKWLQMRLKRFWREGGRAGNQSSILGLPSYLLRFGGTGSPGARRVQSYRT